MKYLVALVATTFLGVTSWFAYNHYWFINKHHKDLNTEEIITVPHNSSESDNDLEEEQGIEFEYEKNEH